MNHFYGVALNVDDAPRWLNPEGSIQKSCGIRKERCKWTLGEPLPLLCISCVLHEKIIAKVMSEIREKEKYREREGEREKV